MSKVVLNIAISLDGYIARLDDRVDYLGEPNDETMKSFKEFTDRCDTVIMGSTSYDQMIELGGNQFPDKNIFVLTSQPYADEENIVFLEAEIDELMDKVSEVANEDIYLFGGAKVVKQFIDADLIDEYIITIAPIIIGTGIPLFLFSNNDLPLELQKSEEVNGFVTLHYKRVR